MKRNAAWIVALFAVAWIALDKSVLVLNDGRYDAGLFYFAGAKWAAGAIPYSDFWDNKPPGIFAVNALYQKFGGHGFCGLAVIEGIVAALTVGVFALLARRVLGPLVFLPAVAFYAFYSNLQIFSERGNLTENYLILPETASAWMAVVALETGSMGAIFACGFLAICAAIFKPVGLAPVLALTVILARIHGASSPLETRSRWLNLAALIGGTFFGFFPWLIWATAHGVLREMNFASLGYNLGYAIIGTSEKKRMALVLARFLPAWLGVIFFFSIGRSVRSALSHSASSQHEILGFKIPIHNPSSIICNLPAWITGFIYVWLAFDYAGAFGGGYGYGHYFLPCIAPLMLAGGMGFAIMLELTPPETATGRFLRVIGALALLAVVPVFGLQLRDVARARSALKISAEQDSSLEKEILRHAKPGDPILVWGHNFALDVRGFDTPLRTLSLLHMAKTPQGSTQLRIELEKLVSLSPASAPKVIVEPHEPRPNFPSLDPEWKEDKSLAWDDEREIIRMMRNWIAENYAPPVRLERAIMFVRKDRP